MAVTEQDLRHIAELARLGLPEDRITSLLEELNGILEHMEVLSRVPTGRVGANASYSHAEMRLRADDGAPLPLERPRESFAPRMRDGFFLVRRLATHGDATEPAP